MATTPHLWVAGVDYFTATYANTHTTAITELQAPNLTVLVQTAAQAIGNASFTAVSFTAANEVVDRGAQHTGTSSRVTAAADGWYDADAGASLAANATGRRLVQFAVSGTAVDGSQRSINALSTGISTLGVSMKVYMTAGQYLELQVYQDSGGSLNTSVSGAASSFLQVAYYST